MAVFLGCVDCRPLTQAVLTYLTNALGTGTSPAAPNCCIRVPAVERFAYQVEFEGLNTAASSLPSLSNADLVLDNCNDSPHIGHKFSNWVLSVFFGHKGSLDMKALVYKSPDC